VLPWLAPRPSVVTIHDLIHLRFPEYLPGRAAFRYARAMIRHAHRRASLVLTVSESSKRDILEWFGGSPERIVVVPNSVDDAFFVERGSDDLERTRERWRLPRRFLLYAGNVKPHKNLQRLLRAFAHLRRRVGGDDDVKLVLMGNDLGRYHGLRRLAAELRLVEHVRFLGWLPGEELAAVLRLATVFAYPSLYEGFGLPPLEAMACGVPVVAGEVASLPEVCGDCAVWVDPLDEEAIARGLERALGDDELRADLARRGAERARRYRLRDQAAATLAVYRRALQ
jgi:glycosyltransferase involved in cell wall biosynthesis